MVESSETTIPQMRPLLGAEHRGMLFGAALYLAFYTGMVLFNTFPPKLPPAIWALQAPITTVCYLLLLTYTLCLFCRLSIRPGRETLLMLGAMLLFLILNPVVREAAWLLLKGRSWNEVLVQLTAAGDDDKSLVGIILQILVPFLLILTGTFFGQILARLIRDRAMLVPVGIIAGLVDFWGVFWGPVGSWSSGAPVAVSKMASAASAAVDIPQSIQLPPQLAVFGHITPPSSIGIGDFVFLALFLTCAYRLGFSPKRSMWGIFCGLLLSSIILALNGQTLFGIDINIAYLPGLVFICGGVLLANIGSWQLSRQEWAMTSAVVAVFLLFIGRSAYVAEAGKPHFSHQTYNFTLTTPSVRDAIQQVRQRIAEKLKPGAEAVPIGARIVMLNPSRTVAKPAACVLFTVERRPHASLSQLHEFDFQAIWDSKKALWHVTLEEWSPPMDAIQLLASLNTKGGDGLAMVNNARALPPGAFALLDGRTLLPNSKTSPKEFVLRLLPDHAEIFAEKQGIINKLTYPMQQ